MRDALGLGQHGDRLGLISVNLRNIDAAVSAA
jgi:hypothetical protein